MTYVSAFHSQFLWIFIYSQNELDLKIEEMKSLMQFLVPLVISLMFSLSELYSQNGEWINIDHLPSEIGLSASAVLDNKIHIIGGHPEFFGDAIGDVIAYDLVADSLITDIANLPFGRGSVAAEALNGKICAIGGQLPYSGGDMEPTIYEYDPDNNSWTRKADMLQARMNHSVVALDDKLLVIGGRTVSYPAPIDSSMVMYDPATDSWSYA